MVFTEEHAIIYKWYETSGPAASCKSLHREASGSFCKLLKNFRIHVHMLFFREYVNTQIVCFQFTFHNPVRRALHWSSREEIMRSKHSPAECHGFFSGFVLMATSFPTRYQVEPKKHASKTCNSPKWFNFFLHTQKQYLDVFQLTSSIKCKFLRFARENLGVFA